MYIDDVLGPKSVILQVFLRFYHIFKFIYMHESLNKNILYIGPCDERLISKFSFSTNPSSLG